MDLYPMKSSTAKGEKRPLSFPFPSCYWRVVEEKDKKPILTEFSGTWVVLEGLGVSGVGHQQYLSMGKEILFRIFLI